MTDELQDIIRAEQEAIYAVGIKKVRQMGPEYEAAPEEPLRRSFDAIFDALADYWERGDEAKARAWAEMRAHLSANLGFPASEVLGGLDLLPGLIRSHLEEHLTGRPDRLAALARLDEGISLLRRRYLDAHFALHEQRLARLHELTVSMGAEPSLKQALECTAAGARELTGARHAALGLPDGTLITSGLTGEETTVAGPLRHLVGALLQGAETVRLRDPAQEPRFAGVPNVGPLVGVPIAARGRMLGVLCLVGKEGGEEFTADDQRLVEMLAAHAATSIERKRAEEELRTTSLYARGLIEASLDPLVTISPDGKITDVNAATELVAGVPREQLVGSDFSDYFTEPEKAREGYQKVLAEGSVTDYPLAIRHASGAVTDVLYNATVYRDEAGEIQGIFAAARDVTERKRAEEEARRLAVSRPLVGQMLSDLEVVGGLSEGAMFLAGRELAARVQADTLGVFLDAFGAMGLGTLAGAEPDAEQRRAAFTGAGLVETREGSGQPTCNYARGFLCGALAHVLGGPPVAGVEVACQSMGDELCRFAIQAVGGTP